MDHQKYFKTAGPVRFICPRTESLTGQQVPEFLGSLMMKVINYDGEP
jgi:hypothetical protein